MARELPSFGEGLSPEIIRAQPAPSPSPASPPPFDKGGQGGFAVLTPEDLAALLCRVPFVRLATGEEGEVVVSAADWRAWMDRHSLVIMRSNYLASR